MPLPSAVRASQRPVTLRIGTTATDRKAGLMCRGKVMLRKQTFALCIGVTLAAAGAMQSRCSLAGWPGKDLARAVLTGLRVTADRKSTRLNSSHLGISYA